MEYAHMSDAHLAKTLLLDGKKDPNYCLAYLLTLAAFKGGSEGGVATVFRDALNVLDEMDAKRQVKTE